MSSRSDQDRAWELIQEIGLCMLVSHDGGGVLRARPMSAHARRDEDAIYFLTDRRAHKDDEIEINENVCLAFTGKGARTHLSVSGTANLLDDRARVAELWSPAARAFWESQDDPDIRILKVRPTLAEIWDGPGRHATPVALEAAISPRSRLGENRKILL